MNNNHANAMPPADLLSKWGFEADLFNADEARKETRLDSVMEYPEWFLEVLGNTKSLNFIIITGPRGAGKSSIRRSISDHCSTRVGNDILGGSILCINMVLVKKWVGKYGIIYTANKLCVAMSFTV